MESRQGLDTAPEQGLGRKRVNTITGLLSDPPISTETSHCEGVTWGVKITHYIIRFFPDVMAVIWTCVMTKLITDVGTQDWLWFVGMYHLSSIVSH